MALTLHQQEKESGVIEVLIKRGERERDDQDGGFLSHEASEGI
jgi:hypothetical protein